MSDIQMNFIYAPYLDCEKRVQIFFGGASSGKSTFLAQRCMLDLLRGGRNYLIVRAVARTLRQSVWNQVGKVIRAAGLAEAFRFSQTDLTLTCLQNGAQAIFAGLDDVEKLKSVTPETGPLTDLWAEEATELDYRSFKQLTKRLRGGNGPGSGPPAMPKRITLSFNPAQKEHWIWREFFVQFDEKKGVCNEENLLILRTTFRDNLFLERDDTAALLEEKDRWFYEVYTEGRWAAPEGAVFQNWRVVDFSEQVHGFDQPRWGLDFGFSADPNALLGCHVDMRRKKIYVFDEFLRGGLHDDELAEVVKVRVGASPVVCDSAEPKAISDLCRRGVRALPAVKGPDSIRFGIRFLQGFEILVSPQCPSAAAEMACYRWMMDKNGKSLPRPEDKNNHLMDALRYAVEDLMQRTRAEAVVRF